MKASLLKSLTPFVSSDLDSRGLRIMCNVINGIYCAGAIVSVFALGIIDPWGVGHLPMAVCTLFVYIVCGMGYQEWRNKNIDEKEEKEFVTIINALFVQKNDVNISVASSSVRNDTKETAEIPTARRQKKKPGPQPFDPNSDESPFVHKEYEDFFGKVMKDYAPQTINARDAIAIAELITKYTVDQGQIPVKSNVRRGTFVLWLYKHYSFLFSGKPAESTLISADLLDEYIDKWRPSLTR